MTERELNAIIANNITVLLDEHNKTQQELAEYMGVTQATVSNWCKGIKVPRMTKIDKICEYFNVTRSQLMEEKTESKQSYYLDPEAAEMAQELYDRPEMRVLFDASRKATKEDIEQVADILKRLSGK